MSDPLSRFDALWQFRNRLRRIFKRRWNYFVHLLSGKRQNDEVMPKSSIPLERGDLVRVKSKEEILKTLNRWNQLKGCSFMEEMEAYCDTRQRVLKRVERFLDERDYRIKKCRGIVLLEGVICQGTKDFGGCDRSCFFFWKQEWLEKVNTPSEGGLPGEVVLGR